MKIVLKESYLILASFSLVKKLLQADTGYAVGIIIIAGNNI